MLVRIDKRNLVARHAIVANSRQNLQSLGLYIERPRIATGRELRLACEIDFEAQVVGPVGGSVGGRKSLGKEGQAGSGRAQGAVWVNAVKDVGVPVVIWPSTSEAGILSGVAAPSVSATVALAK